ncbi:hypothetical protein V8E54_011256 [Elaphomyces granulatus]
MPGCAQPVKLSLNPRSLFLPIPAVMPPKLESEVKLRYKATCVITGINTSWMSFQFGIGIENCHIVPKSMYAWYPWEDNDAHSLRDSWYAVNRISNCMTMESVSHRLYDNRALAVHPDSYKIRLFAPIKHLMTRNNQEAFFQDKPPSEISLAWHYRMTVMENMGALLLQAKGGAKRIPWRQGPSAISVQKDQNNNQSADPELVGAQPEQGTAPGVTSSALLSRHHMITSPLLDSPNDSDSEDSDDWQYGFTSELDHRLQNLFYYTGFLSEAINIPSSLATAYHICSTYFSGLAASLAFLPKDSSNITPSPIQILILYAALAHSSVFSHKYGASIA